MDWDPVISSITHIILSDEAQKRKKYFLLTEQIAFMPGQKEENFGFGFFGSYRMRIDIFNCKR